MSIGGGYTYSYIFKYIIVGDMGVGKSCLMHQFTEKKFIQDCPHTIGVEFATKIIEVDDQKIKIQIWDTAGQERFRAVTRSYYRGAAGAFLVYDITKKSTFYRIQTWLTDARRLTSHNTVLMMIGNKQDLEQLREVTYDEAKQLADENGLIFMECSAKSGLNVEEAFIKTARKIFENVQNGSVNLNSVDGGVLSKGTMGVGTGRVNSELNSTNVTGETSGRQTSGCSC